MADLPYQFNGGPRPSMFDQTSSDIGSSNFGSSMNGWSQGQTGTMNFNPVAQFGGFGGGGIQKSPFSFAPESGGMFGEGGMFGDMGMKDWGNAALGGIEAASGLMAAFNGWEQNKMAKKNLAQGQENFESNFNNQAQANNTFMRDRQVARNITSNGRMPTADEYMAKNKVQGI